MSTELVLTLTGFFVTVGIAALAAWQARKPAEPLNVRLIDYYYVVILAIVVLLVLGVRLVRLISGHT